MSKLQTESTPDTQDDAFSSLLLKEFPEEFRDPKLLKQVLYYRKLVLTENKAQNLTRLISPEDFVYRHVLDVVSLHKCGFLEYPALDWGSGMGVPGLLSAILYGGSWVLLESEKNKARFLQETVEKLGLSNQIRIIPERAEAWLKAPDNRVKSIVARAVGPIDRFWGWLNKCSTWNNLVLLKGQKWEAEWTGFKGKQTKSGWEVFGKYSYQSQGRRYNILKIVPRGTNFSVDQSTNHG